MPKAKEAGGMRLEAMPIAKLQSAARNPKLHSPGIGTSIGRFGYVEPIVLDERTGRIVAGHGRRDALLAMQAAGEAAPAGVVVKGGEWLAPVMRGWSSRSDAEAEAYLVASNKLVEAGGWDDAQLVALLKDLGSAGGLEGVWFEASELEQLLAERTEKGLTDADEVPEPAADPYVKAGELWLLGKHRLFCGDSTNAEDVARLMGDEKADACWTDPPYGVSYRGGTDEHKTISGDDAEGLPVLLAGAFAQAMAALKEGAAIYVAHPAGALSAIFIAEFVAAGFRLHETLVWLKDSMVLGHSDYHYIHEPVLYGYTPGGGRRGRGGAGWYGDNSQVSVQQIARPKRSEEHPTMKPVELVEVHLRNSALPGQIVFEPFSGSGTTILACERLGMRARAMEIEPRYVQVAIERWQGFTGKKATKE